MKESRYTEAIGVLLGFRFSAVRQTLRTLREAGLVPGLRGGDLQPEQLPAVILGLCAPTFATAADTYERLAALRLADAADLPKSAGDALTAIVRILPRSPVLGSLDLDDGFLTVGNGQMTIDALSLAGKRAVVRYGTSDNADNALHRFPLNGIRELVKTMEKK
ncbi:hypothetical protein [Affinirhizobium pseudoryzae]|uniref:hypothetical protein n=1 Tax=Allorhizobium pseudoryzae TaxID=379684 RepID=UPI0013EAAD88|nr:hypothetical protein [Allorhizobium pseudoryzae]